MQIPERIAKNHQQQISCMNVTCLAYIFTDHILQMTYLLSIFEQPSISNLCETFWYCAVRYRTVSIHRQAVADRAASTRDNGSESIL